MSFWANYFSSIFQTQRLFCYSVAIAIINAIDSANNKKSFSALPQPCGLGSLTAVSPSQQGGIPLQHKTGRLASCTVNSQSDGRGNSSVQLVAWDESAPILPSVVLKLTQRTRAPGCPKAAIQPLNAIKNFHK